MTNDMPEEIWAEELGMTKHKFRYGSWIADKDTPDLVKFTRSDISEKTIATLEQQIKKIHEQRDKEYSERPHE